VRVPDAPRFCETLADLGVYVRDRSTIAQMRNYLRMSVGTLAQTREVLERVDTALALLSAHQLGT
jgi:histidinol-phosphate/aromatic aminotransferase/cobyric acid decarboxylase-like protein